LQKKQKNKSKNNKKKQKTKTKTKTKNPQKTKTKTTTKKPKKQKPKPNQTNKQTNKRPSFISTEKGLLKQCHGFERAWFGVGQDTKGDAGRRKQCRWSGAITVLVGEILEICKLKNTYGLNIQSLYFKFLLVKKLIEELMDDKKYCPCVVSNGMAAYSTPRKRLLS